MITWDKFGHCVMCHKNMLIEQAIDGKIQNRFTPEYQETEFLLDDGSRMRVAICETCKNELKVEDEPKIMECVKLGWEVEVEGIKTWTAEKKSNYLKKYSKKNIICNSERMPKDILEKKFKEHKDKNGTHR